MTTANKITIVRILLIPVFVLLAVYYGESVEAGKPDRWLRYGAIAVFLIASASDGLDGYIARKTGQVSKLGTILDPIADKGLLVTTLITLSVINWGAKFPAWFPILVISRDLILVIGWLVLHYVHGRVRIVPSWVGKFATFAQMAAIAWVMLQIPWFDYMIIVWIAGFFTFVSGALYTIDGFQQLHDPPP